jgi:hypothetical protein
VFVALQADGKRGGVVALHDAKGDGRFDVKEHFGQDSLTESCFEMDTCMSQGFMTCCDTSWKPENFSRTRRRKSSSLDWSSTAQEDGQAVRDWSPSNAGDSHGTMALCSLL